LAACPKIEWRCAVSVLIPWKETLEGAKLAVDNAERIAYDANSLSRAGRYQTAFSLSLLAWEETNKAGLLIRAYIERQGITHNPRCILRFRV
jgi:hypothetical protein